MYARRSSIAVAVAVLLLFASGSFADEGWGHFKGRFVYDGDPPKVVEIQTPGITPEKPLVWQCPQVDAKTRGIAGIVIYARGRDLREHPEHVKRAQQEVRLESKDYRIEPRVVLVRVNQPMRIVAGNGSNLNFQPMGEGGFGQMIRPHQAVEKYSKAHAPPQAVGCNVYPWIRGYVVIRPNTYAAVSGADGAFEIKNLPAGELEFQLWHEEPGYLAAKPEWEKGRFKVSIKAGETADLGTIKLAPKLFEKP